MRSVLGALIGLVFGVAVVVGFAVGGGIYDYWVTIPVGVVVGIVVRGIAASMQTSYLAGGLAALASVGAMYVGQQAAAVVTKSMTPTKATPTAVAKADTSADDEAETTAKAAAPAPTPISEAIPTAAGGGVSASKADYQALDAVFLAVGALVAYQLGKGSGRSPAEASSDEGDQAGEGGEDADADEPRDGE